MQLALSVVAPCGIFECLLRRLSTPDTTRSRSHFSDCGSKIEADQAQAEARVEATTGRQIIRQQQQQHRCDFLFLFLFSSDLGLFLAGRTRCCSCCSPCLDKSSLQFVPPFSRSLSAPLPLPLSLSLHNCRLLIDRCNNVMDAQPAFDATTREATTRTHDDPPLYTRIQAWVSKPIMV